MRFNTDPSFVGLEKLKQTHHEQVADFEKWAKCNDWERFHYSHYDWWAFPIDRPSSYGFAWTIYAGEVFLLQEDYEFINEYQRGVILVAASWGWDLLQQTYFLKTAPGQSWHHWPIRLYKMTQSVNLFGFEEYFNSLRKYGRLLLEKGEPFIFNGRDLRDLFL